MAAFPSRDRAAFDAHWERNIFGNPLNLMQTILVDDDVAGNIGSWTHNDERFVGYWIGKAYWGRGVATRALHAFLDVEQTRPLYAHVVQRNAGSIRVLEKCGFREDSTVMLSEAGVIELRFVLR